MGLSSESGRNWLRKNPEGKRRYNLLYRFKLTLDQYNALLQKQREVCCICKQPEKIKKRDKIIALTVDHDHNTGKIRGLLCSRCNVALGQFSDSISLLKAAIAYLKKHSA